MVHPFRTIFLAGQWSALFWTFSLSVVHPFGTFSLSVVHPFGTFSLPVVHPFGIFLCLLFALLESSLFCVVHPFFGTISLSLVHSFVTLSLSMVHPFGTLSPIVGPLKNLLSEDFFWHHAPFLVDQRKRAKILFLSFSLSEWTPPTPRNELRPTFWYLQSLCQRANIFGLAFFLDVSSFSRLRDLFTYYKITCPFPHIITLSFKLLHKYWHLLGTLISVVLFTYIWDSLYKRFEHLFSFWGCFIKPTSCLSASVCLIVRLLWLISHTKCMVYFSFFKFSFYYFV